MLTEPTRTEPSQASITLIVLTRDEERHIGRCLRSAIGTVSRIVVVDSYSTDRTIEIAHDLGAHVVQHTFRNQAEQFQWALDEIDIGTDWVLRLDADEYLEPELAHEIRTRLPGLPADVTGINLRRKVIFRDQWIRYGGIYPSIFLRLWRHGSARIEQRWMDEHAVLTKGHAVTFAHDFADHNLNDITWWTDKHNRFTTRQMVDFLNLELGMFPVDRDLEEGRGSQARWKRFLRNRVFARTPLYVRGLLYFAQRYLLRLGFLDGRNGFVFHFLQGCWNWILVDAKIDEAR